MVTSAVNYMFLCLGCGCSVASLPFKETGVGLLNVLMCDCITNAFYLMIILVSGDSLDE